MNIPNEDERSDQDRKPGWYPDPEGGPRQRWWDGTVWRTQPRSRKLEARAAWWAGVMADGGPSTDLRTALTGRRDNTVRIVDTRPNRESVEPKTVRVVEVVDLDSPD